MSDDLAIRATVRELVAAFVIAEADVRDAFAAIVNAERRLNAAFAIEGTGRIRVDASRGGYHDSFDDPDHAIGRMTRAAWQAIAERLELRRFMSIKRWEALTEHLNTGKLPPITEESVTAFARGHLTSMCDMLKEAVDEVFEWLRPHKGTKAGDLKTNTEMEVGAKAILSSVVERCWIGSGFTVCSYRRQHLIAMENVFNGLAGNGEICKGYQSLLQTAIEASAGVGETSLFRFRVFGNGNLHLGFKRLDLLERFNQIAGGMRLRP